MIVDYFADEQKSEAERETDEYIAGLTPEEQDEYWAGMERKREARRAAEEAMQ